MRNTVLISSVFKNIARIVPYWSQMSFRIVHHPQRAAEKTRVKVFSWKIFLDHFFSDSAFFFVPRKIRFWKSEDNFETSWVRFREFFQPIAEKNVVLVAISVQ